MGALGKGFSGLVELNAAIPRAFASLRAGSCQKRKGGGDLSDATTSALRPGGRTHPGPVGGVSFRTMKLRKGVLLFVTVVVLGVGSFFAYRAFAKRRDLQETLSWIDQTYNPHEGGDNLGQGHGWEIHYLRKGDVEEITQKFNTTVTLDGDCNVVTRSETFPVGVYSETPSVTTYKFSLRDIDPDSIKIKTYDLHKDVFSCADPEQVQAYGLNCDNAEIEFLTRNGATSINEDMLTTFTKLTGSDHESRNISKTAKGWWVVDDVPYSQRLARALKHAVELCGGRASRF